MFYVPRVEMVINPPWEQTLSGSQGLASPEQTATGKDISNPFMAVMTCQKSYSSSTSYDSCSESGKWFQSSMDHPLSGPRFDFHNAVKVFGICPRKIKQIRDQDHDSILKLTTADLLRNLKLTKSNSSLGEDC
ncbi:hypothetical protein Tco_0897401 [Tanacetum coccineum]|uniref:Uncharacterized protein n=1 Tax=Tanacetum coccineum TaxID=301880 RepID=A0ABQ5G5Z0_9ASTR